MQLHTQSKQSMECGFTVQEYLDHLQQVLQMPSMVHVVDIRKEGSKKYIYKAQDVINLAKAVKLKTNQQIMSFQKGDISTSIQGSDNSMVTNEGIYVAKIKQGIPTNGITSRTQNTVQCNSAYSNNKEEFISEDISNFITEVNENVVPLEITVDQPIPDSSDVEKLQIFPNGVPIKHVADEIFIKKAVIKDQPQMVPFGNKVTVPPLNPHTKIYASSNNSPNWPCNSPSRQPKSPPHRRSRSPRKYSQQSRTPPYTKSRSPIIPRKYGRQSSSPSYKRSKSQMRRCEENEYVKQMDGCWVIYIGCIAEGTTRAQLRDRFSKFGTIIAVSVHFMVDRDNYGFVTFRNSKEACKAIEHGNDDTSLPYYNIYFGKRWASFKSPSRIYALQSRSQSYIISRSPRRRSKSPSYRKSRSPRRRHAEDERMKQGEERLTIYIGRITEGTTRTQLRDRFSKFGTITYISLHFRDQGDNYAFVAFSKCDEAFKAIEHGNEDTSLPHYDLSFGGRREFLINVPYSDLDVQYKADYGWGVLQGYCSDGGVSCDSAAPMDFDALLKAAMKSQQNKKLTCGSKIFSDTAFGK